MPLVRVSLRRGKSAAYRRAIADGIHRALIDAIGIPAADRFQVISEHDADGLIYDANYLGIARTDDVLFVQIALRRGRTNDMKRALYRNIVANLGKDPGLRAQDVLIALVENDVADWSFGEGEAQYLTRPADIAVAPPTREAVPVEL